MSHRLDVLPAVCAALTIACAVSAQSPPPSGTTEEALFNAKCKSCHDPAIEHAPTKADLALRPRGEVIAALTTGKMVPMAQGLSPAQIELIANYLVPTPGTSASTTGPARPGIPSALVGIDNMCEVNKPIRASSSDWRSMGFDNADSRYQTHPGLRASDVPRLKLKWAFSLAGGGQPTVVGDWLFTTNRGGKLYALDAKTGCVHWAVDGAASRTTPMIIHSSVSPSGWMTFIGVGGRVVRAFDAQTGEELWKSEPLDTHPASAISGAPVVWGNEIFVPLSSGEEAAAIQKNGSSGVSVGKNGLSLTLRSLYS